MHKKNMIVDSTSNFQPRTGFKIQTSLKAGNKCEECIDKCNDYEKFTDPWYLCLTAKNCAGYCSMYEPYLDKA